MQSVHILKRQNGEAAETHAQALLGGQFAQEAAYDLVTHEALIEIKSCQLFIQNGQLKRLGMFTLNLDAHVELYLRARQANKKPLYFFLVVIGGSYLTCTKTWEEIDLLISKPVSHIPLSKVFT